MTQLPRLLLVNPRITSRRSARFPLAVLNLAAAMEGRYDCRIVDGNVDDDYMQTTRRLLREEQFAAAGITAMGGPQVGTAIAVSTIIRQASPTTPIIWGGYFPSLYPEAAINAPYVDYVVRGPGEAALMELLDAIRTGDEADFAAVRGIGWKRGGQIVRNPDRRFEAYTHQGLLPYDLLGDPRSYLAKTFLGRRTVAHQASIGCRFRCTFCGVASMFRGATVLPPAQRLERDLAWMKDLGADSVQYFDHNFFDREKDMVPLLEVMARAQLPWWCFARADALLDLSASSWALVRKSRLRMAYIGAESPSDAMLKSMRKGTTADQTLAVTDLCRRHGVIPELSFMVAPPVDTENETERTFEFIREVKRVNPRAEIIIYIHTPLAPSALPENVRARATVPVDRNGDPLRFPSTPEEWTQKEWVDYSCHADAPWMTDRLRMRIKSFVTVLGCRFPTVQDVRAPGWSKMTLRALASWRYRFRQYDRPWELDLSKKLIRLAEPRVSGI
jgi:radical SAM superfamily enzyme YgiQ (UPF0313 family)